MKPIPVVLLVIGSCLVGACACGPAPIEAPALDLRIEHRAGGVFRTAVEASGPRTNDALDVEVQVFATAPGWLDDIAHDAQREVVLVVDPTSDEPLRGVADRLDRWSVVERGRHDVVADRMSAATETDAVACAERSALLLDASTVEVSLADGEFASAGVRIARDGDRLRVALWDRGEVGVLERGMDLGSTLWFVLHSGTTETPDLAFRVLVARADDPDLLDVAAAHFEIAGNIEQSASEVAPWSDGELRRTGLELAWEGLAASESARAALAMLAPGRGSVVHDVSIVAEPPAIEACAAHLRGALTPRFDESDATRWSVECEVVALLAERVARAECTKGEPGLLLRHFGELGRFPDELARTVRRSTSSADFASRVVDENRRALGASDPAARVRALDWLAHRGIAPDGFDPFASREARRAALKASEPRRVEERR